MNQCHMNMNNELVQNTGRLLQRIQEILEEARNKVYRTANTEMLRAYWNIGREIVEEEQKGKDRAAYGSALLEELATRLTDIYGKSFSSRNLRYMRQFYREFSKWNAVRSELSWTHYRILLKIEKSKEVMQSGNIIKDPFVLEFLDVKENKNLSESRLESALIEKLQQFILELGNGFSFVDRQYRITTNNEHFYIDLVFYNYILKCFLLIELKTEKLTHQDIGQMDFYVRIFEDQLKQPGDNPTIGLILCTEKNGRYNGRENRSSKRRIYPANDHLPALLINQDDILPFIIACNQAVF